MSNPTQKVRRIVIERSGGWCEWRDCPYAATETHHRLGRKTGGRHGEMDERINQPAWLLRCCRRHHELVTSAHGPARAEALATGWLLLEGQDARDVPVLTRLWAEPIWLDDDGCWETDVGREARGAYPFGAAAPLA